MTTPTDKQPKIALLTLTGDIVTAHLGHNRVPAADLPSLIASVYGALETLGKEPDHQITDELTPAVPIRQSVKPDYIVCLEDGKKMIMLKRHLLRVYGMTPDDYRKRWNLPADYPMNAPNYARKRSEIDKSNGLGRKPDQSQSLAMNEGTAATE